MSAGTRWALRTRSPDKALAIARLAVEGSGAA